MTDDTRDAQTWPFDGPDDWGMYAWTYWDAAERILDEARGYAFLIHPGLFLVRHHVELVFKKLLHESGEEVPIHHDLRRLWQQVRGLAVFPDNKHATPDLMTRVTEVVEALAAIDPGSFSFRYPVDTKGQPRGFTGQLSARHVLDWARQVHEALGALDTAVEMSDIDRQTEREMWEYYGGW